MFFCPTLGAGGADRVVLTLLRHLDRRRITPILAVMRREGALIGDVPGDVEVISLDAPRLAAAAPALARKLRRIRPDVVFSTHGGPNVIVSVAHALAVSRARLVLSERSTLLRADHSRLRTAVELPAKRVTYRRADLITAVSQGVADQLVRLLGLAVGKIRVVYNPVVDDDLTELAREPVRHPWFADPTIPIILAVGRLVAIKDYPTLLAAFARVRAARQARLVVLGDGPLLPALRQRAAELRIAADVDFLGFDKNPFKYMARSTLLLHASKAEGLPGALIQAMACGKPVVATDCDFGPREVIQRDVDGFLVPVGDARQLADHALRLLDDPTFASGVGERARRAARRFSTASAVGSYANAITGDVAW
jgi:glycosyltransferase involved in cell wall biosynthesis